MSAPRHVSLIVLGVGNVGRAFLTQLLQTRPALEQRYGVELQPVALADSSGALFASGGLATKDIEAALDAKHQSYALADQPDAVRGITSAEIIQRALENGIERALVVDTTAADGMEAPLRTALENGYGVVLANKRPLAGEWKGARVFFESSRTRFEATVGAGLPVVNTLRYLVDTGDEVQRIEGALSGTLGYICSRLEDGEAFSAAVNSARAQGYTEPDPRDDLSGMDVARKALILARLAGWSLEMSDIRVNPLYPTEMADMSVEEFMAHLPELNAGFAAYMGAQTGIPRYMAEISPQGGVVALRMVGERIAAQLRDTLNQVSFTTHRYAHYPLTLLGPGAGIEVTAAAVLQDCVQLAVTGHG